MFDLNFPEFEPRLKREGKGLKIYDIIRKKYVVLTPEEWVRQHVVHYLIRYKGFPTALMAVEREISLFGRKKRFDILCFDKKGDCAMIVECKAPDIPITQEVFDQVFAYNMEVEAGYVAVTNGYSHYCCKMEADGKIRLMEDFPESRFFDPEEVVS